MSDDNWHIGGDGEPHKCTARAGHCPLGGEHYPTKKATEHAIEEQGRRGHAIARLTKGTVGGSDNGVPSPVTPDSAPSDILRAWVGYNSRIGEGEDGSFNPDKALSMLDNESPEWGRVRKIMEDEEWLVEHGHDVAKYGSPYQRLAVALHGADDVELTRELLNRGTGSGPMQAAIKKAVAKHMPLDDRMVSDPEVFGNAIRNPYLTHRQKKVVYHIRHVEDDPQFYDVETHTYTHEGLKRRLMNSRAYFPPLNPENEQMVMDDPELLYMACNSTNRVLRAKAARTAAGQSGYDFRGTTVTPDDSAFNEDTYLTGCMFNVDGIDIDYTGYSSAGSVRNDGFTSITLDDGDDGDLTLVNHHRDGVRGEPEPTYSRSELRRQVRNTLSDIGKTYTPLEEDDVFQEVGQVRRLS